MKNLCRLIAFIVNCACNCLNGSCSFVAMTIIATRLSITEAGTTAVDTAAVGTAEVEAEARQCSGIQVDYSRLQALTEADIHTIINPSSQERSFNPFQSQRIMSARSANVEIGTRIRLEETISQVKLHGAEVIVMLEPCGQGQICANNIERISGKTFTEINVTEGYIPTYSQLQAKQELANIFNVLDLQNDITDLTLQVYPTQQGDFLVYVGEVFTNNKPQQQEILAQTQTQLYNVVIDANSLQIVQQCNLIVPKSDYQTLRHRNRNRKRQKERRLRSSTDNAQQPQQQRNLDICQSCAAPFDDKISWSTTTAGCTINTLYLNNTNRTTLCVRDSTDSYSGPGPIPQYFWEGTYDCNSTTTDCNIVPLPECPDAASDTQYAAIQTLQFYQQFLGLKGGLSVDASKPRPLRAHVHYDEHYCNAFFRPGKDALYFGDCDCEFRTPLTPIDIVAHEISHGVIKYSSGLGISFQPGGLNEGFSDIAAIAVDFLIHDSIDTPDFTIGETIGENPIRSIEQPSGRYISSVCDFNRDTESHHASGPLDLAYHTAVMSCVQSGCAGTDDPIRECVVLLSSSFMYSNMQGLTQLSGYLDAAHATCNLVDEFFEVHTPENYTLCRDTKQIKQFVIEGWCKVNIALTDNCEASYQCGQEGQCGKVDGNGYNPEDGIPGWVYGLVKVYNSATLATFLRVSTWLPRTGMSYVGRIMQMFGYGK